MQDYIMVTGMVLKIVPVGDYDRSVTILTRERGKLSAFAKGSRRQGNRLAAAANPFSFGTFKLFVGKSSYTILDADITNYFEELREDFEGAYYGIYFLEIADYYARENNDEKELLKLLYQSLRALVHPGYDNRLVRYIFEIKAMTVNGEFPGIDKEEGLDPSTVYAVDYIVRAAVEKLYTFTVTEKVLGQLGRIAEKNRKKVFDREFKSLEVLDKLYVENVE